VRRRVRLRGGDAGFVGGAEALLFGVLVCLVTSLLAAAVWGAAGARVAASTAAREGARAYVEHQGGGDPSGAAEATARDVLVERGRDPERAAVEVGVDAFARCRRVVVDVAYDLPAVALPFGHAIGAVTVHGRASELVDPYRDDVPGEATCG
jgi:hypothetical protein